ncbi:MAG: gliding motility-associated C-terminal domain-containing protein, partial [Bacteroidales bacterium]|nr:gliding motility-associated C-terminal domain-containing protein [Bacteroidales bacterium]
SWSSWECRNDSGKEMPEGTYYYILKVSSKETEAKMTKSGFIVLKRK